MAKSAPHIYLSALPFAPTCSLVSTHYSTSFSQILHVARGQLSHWPSSEMVISNPGRWPATVKSVAFSPDGQHIVSGSTDRTIRVWNAMTGETAAGSFTLAGHTDYVFLESVTLSPDGQHIVSGSSDGTIRVWNAMTGETAAGPFTVHTGPVFSVAFLPDGQHIVSGSADGTICVWNAMTGETAAGPFTVHTGPVNSVAFSPDDPHIVSGSSDGTILLSNVTMRKTETTNDVDFIDRSMINDEGWVLCGSEGELLMWVPSVYRECLQPPSTIWISGKHVASLNLSNFVHGRSWVTCITRY